MYYTSGCYEFYFDDTKVSLEEFTGIIDVYSIYGKLQYLYHPEDLPSMIVHINNDIYYHYVTLGKYHRLNGPAFYSRSGLVEPLYTLFGRDFIKEDYDDAMEYLDRNGEVAFKLRYA